MPGSAHLTMGLERPYEDNLPVSPTPTMSSSGSRDSMSNGSTRDYKGSRAFRESREYIDTRKIASSSYDVRSESSESVDEKSTSGSSHKHDLSSEFIPTRTTKVATSRPAYNPLQFIRTGPAPLFQTAQQQLKQAEELKKIRTVVKEEPEEWQANLEGWKINRRKRQEDVIERVTEVKKFEKDEAWTKCDEASKKTAKFNQLMEKRPSRARLMDLNVYTDDNNDLGELLSPTSPREVEQLAPTLTGKVEDVPRLEEVKELKVLKEVKELKHVETEEYTYDKAIESYRKVTSALTKSETYVEPTRPKEEGWRSSKDDNTCSSKEVVVRRSKKVEETVSLLTSAKDTNGETLGRSKVVETKGEVLVKRRSFFEKSNSEEKEAAKLNRRSMDLSDTLRGKIASLELNAELGSKTRVTPDRDPGFLQKLASFKSTEINSVSNLLPMSSRRNSYTKAITQTFHNSEENLKDSSNYINCPKLTNENNSPLISETIEETSIDFRSRLELFRNAEQNPTTESNNPDRGTRSKPAKIDLHVPIPQEESDCTEDEGIRSLSPRSSDSPNSPTDPICLGHADRNRTVVQSFEESYVRGLACTAQEQVYQPAPPVREAVEVEEIIAEETEIIQEEYEQSQPALSMGVGIKEEQQQQIIEDQHVSDYSKEPEELQELQDCLQEPTSTPLPVSITAVGTQEPTILDVDVPVPQSRGTDLDYSQLVWEALPSLSLGSFAPTSLAPPTEKPPPPPPTEPPGETEEERFRRIGSTKRIRKEISRRRSDFLGIENESYYVDADALVPPPPSIEKILAQAEVRSQVTFYEDFNQAPPPLPAAKPPPVPTWLTEAEEPCGYAYEHAMNNDDSFGDSAQDLQEYVHEALQQVDEEFSLDDEDLERKEREIIEILEREENMLHAPEPQKPDSTKQIQLEPSCYQESVQETFQEGFQAGFQPEEEQEQIWTQQEVLIRQRKENDEWEKQILEEENEKNYRELQELEYRQVKQLARIPQAYHAEPPQARPRKLLVEPISVSVPISEPSAFKKLPPPVPIKPSRLSLGAAPPIPAVPKSTSLSNLSRLRASDPDMEPPKRKLITEKRDVSRHWLIQEAEQRRITELKERNSKRSSEASSGSTSPLLSTRSLSSGSIHTSPDQSTHSYPVRSVTSGSVDHIQGLGTHNSNTAAYNARLHSKSVSSLSQPCPELKRNWPQDNYAQQQIYANWQHVPSQEPPRLPPQPLPPAIIESLTQKVASKNNYPNYGNYMNVSELNYNRYEESGPGPQVPHPPLSSSRSAPVLASQAPHTRPFHQPNQDRLLSVSGKKKCSLCGDELGRGAAMIIESLKLFYHMECFCCSVCGVKLGNGTIGTDVRVRNNHLHCHDCYSNDQGLKFSKV